MNSKKKKIVPAASDRRNTVVGCQKRSPLTARLSSGSWLGCLLLCHCRRTDQGHIVLYVFVGTDTHAGSACSQTPVYPSPPWTHLKEERKVYSIWDIKCVLDCSYALYWSSSASGPAEGWGTPQREGDQEVLTLNFQGWHAGQPGEICHLVDDRIRSSDILLDTLFTNYVL